MRSVEREEVLAQLRALAGRIGALCGDLTDQELRWRPDEGEWSILEVCCHLWDAAEGTGLGLRRLLEGEAPSGGPEAPRRGHDYREADPRRVLTALRAYWGGLAYQLERLSEDEWRRPGDLSGREQVTAASLAERALRHAQEHLKQIESIRRLIPGKG